MPRLCDRIGVIGGGFVGRAIARGFLEHCGEVRINDVVPERSTHTLAEACDSDWTFVCVPTPAGNDGRCDTSILQTVIGNAAAAKVRHGWSEYPRLVIKSTIPVGFTRRMQELHQEYVTILHSPEFLTQRCALVDFQTPARNIVGVPGGWEPGTDDEINMATCRLRAMYEKRFPGVPCMVMSSDESELVKLAQNGFFATKVAYFNAIYQLAQATGCDFEAVRAGMLADGRIAHAHTEVPGQHGVGYAGACLPKDMQSLVMMMQNAGLGYEMSWLNSIHICNDARRRV